MNKNKHLEAKGDFDYDYQNDILFFKVKEREYSHSLELGDFVIDIDKEGFVVGVQVFDASEYFNMSKNLLRQVKNWKLQASIENGIIEIRLLFNSMIRNRIIEKNPIIVHKIEEDLPDSSMVSYVTH